MIFQKMQNRRRHHLALNRLVTYTVTGILGLTLFSGCVTPGDKQNEVKPAEPNPANQTRAPEKTSVPDSASKNAVKAPEASPRPPTLAPEQIALNDGIALYDKGDYNAAIKLLNDLSELSGTNKNIQLKALKFMAFSYCLTKRQALCKQQFEKALKLDPTFDLDPGEKGHPLWSPVFSKVKKAK